jgi:hypothetical protein
MFPGFLPDRKTGIDNPGVIGYNRGVIMAIDFIVEI